MQNKENRKHLNKTLEVIALLQKDGLGVINYRGTPFDKVIVNITKNQKKGYSFTIENLHKISFKLTTLSEVEIQTNRFNLLVEKIFINSIQFPKYVKGVFGSYKQKGFKIDNKYSYRLIIPIPKKLNFHYFVSPKSFSDKLMEYSYCTGIKLNNIDFDLYCYEKDEAIYAIIDTYENISFSNFSDLAHSILISYGFITGNFIQNEGFYFAYSDDKMEDPVQFCYKELRDSINSQYTPIYGNAYGYIDDKKIAEKVYPTLKILTQNQFSTLCEKVNNSIEFASVLILMLEASTSSLLSMPSGFSVSLEAITDLICTENEDKIRLLSKKQSKEIRKELIQVLNSFQSKYNEEFKEEKEEVLRLKEVFSILQNKINSNLIQQPNRNKLRLPFEILKISLTKEDEQAIEHRNDFLHGRFYLNDNIQNMKEGNEAILEVYFISLRLYTLISAIIMKTIGFDNKIVNYPKIHENMFNKELNEEYFRQI